MNMVWHNNMTINGSARIYSEYVVNCAVNYTVVSACDKWPISVNCGRILDDREQILDDLDDCGRIISAPTISPPSYMTFSNAPHEKAALY
jgi:hypothetical protein